MVDEGETLDDPIGYFSTLFERASQEEAESNAMVLSTVDADGRPSGRYVLLKAVDDRGFVFYTNMGSRKAHALAVNAQAALTFYWPTIEKQVRVEGRVEHVTDAEADGYFATRPREFQIGAWASSQSDTLASRAALEERVRDAAARFDGAVVSRPPSWSGFRVVPDRIEFWTRDPHRLHHRLLFERLDGAWIRSFLFP
jgi:pyridoxamine 5'-phosphate oxidase